MYCDALIRTPQAGNQANGSKAYQRALFIDKKIPISKGPALFSKLTDRIQVNNQKSLQKGSFFVLTSAD